MLGGKNSIEYFCSSKKKYHGVVYNELSQATNIRRNKYMLIKTVYIYTNNKYSSPSSSCETGSSPFVTRYLSKCGFLSPFGNNPKRKH